LQATGLPLSRRQEKVDPASVPWKVKVALVLVVFAAGFVSRTVPGFFAARAVVVPRAERSVTATPRAPSRMLAVRQVRSVRQVR
jgi:hypothetical protein